MIRLTYVLMAKGKANGIRLLNGQFIKTEEPIDAVYYGSKGYVIGNDEESCLAQIRPKLKRKYEGIRILSIDSVEKTPKEELQDHSTHT